MNSTVVLVTEDVFGQCMQVAGDTTRKSSSSDSMAMQGLHAQGKLIWAGTWQKGACVIFLVGLDLVLGIVQLIQVW